jgi:glycosyltransferase involved in cell wall biosynthesis
MGDSPERQLERHVEALGLASLVQFKPGLSRWEMRDCLRSLDVFVLPSHQEGLCIAALEAMACGVPVVSTRCGGPEEFVVDGETGLLVDGAPEAMANAIATILGNEGLRIRMSGGARAIVERRYTERAAAATLIGGLEAVFPSIVRASESVPA